MQHTTKTQPATPCRHCNGLNNSICGKMVASCCNSSRLHNRCVTVTEASVVNDSRPLQQLDTGLVAGSLPFTAPVVTRCNL